MKTKMIFVAAMFMSLAACNSKKINNVVQGKVERDEIAIVGKLAGRIQEIRVNEGDMVKQGDTLAILDIPELRAKKSQANGAIKSAEAQYQMSKKGATDNQLKQLYAKKAALTEQYEFAKISKERLHKMVIDSLVPQQQYDEVYAKYQGASAQLTAVNAEIADVQNGVRIEQQQMALGQQDRAIGVMEEVHIAECEKYIIAPQDMVVSNITLKVGELALPGYTLIKGTLESSTYFRFTVPESALSQYQKGATIEVKSAFGETAYKGSIRNIKQIGNYANIASAYPDYEMQDMLYEIIISPEDVSLTKDLITKSTVIIMK